MSTDITTQLSYLGFKRIPPSPPLAPYVECYWIIHRPEPLKEFTEEFWHSVGGFGVVFNWGDDLFTDREALPRHHFVGSSVTSQKLGLHGKIEALGVRFRAGGAYPFWRIPLSEMMNGHVGIDVVVDAETRSTFRQIEDAVTIEERITLLEGWLMGHLVNVDERLPMVQTSLAWIRRAKGQLTIPDVAERLYISQRQLERLYKTHVGVSPKKYARLLRVEAARIRLNHDRSTSEAEIGNDTGFYDQAHFIREFKSIVGMTPHDYMLRSVQRGATTS